MNKKMRLTVSFVAATAIVGAVSAIFEPVPRALAFTLAAAVLTLLPPALDYLAARAPAIRRESASANEVRHD